MADPRDPSQPPQPDPLEGLPYRVLQPLGSGAHGVVFEAEQVALRRKVVIKLLHEQYAGREDVADRLRLEAQTIATLGPRTPHVVQVLDYGSTAAGRPYIVMERLEGRTLDDELQARGALPPVEAMDIAVQILDGLAAAHEAGIVHRDVKPDNVFLCPAPGGKRTVKLLDFGLAKLARDLSGEGGPAPLVKPTEQGTILGTPIYFSPEQARGEPATAQSDLYSTGVVLYTMLAGRPPFVTGENVYALIRAHLLDAPPPLSTTAPQTIPDALDRAVRKALAKRPEDRQRSAAELRDEIERALRAAPCLAETEKMDLGGLVPPSPRRRLSRLLALGIMAFATSLLVAAAATLAVRWKVRPRAAVSVMASETATVAPSAPPPPPTITPLPVMAEPAPAASEPPPAHTQEPPRPRPANPHPAPVARPVSPAPLPPPAPSPSPSPPPKASHRVFGSEE